jgi:Uma2 family endonuclease
MAGGTRWHNVLSGRIYAALLRHLEGKTCMPYMADLRLYIENHKHYVYPDVMVVCGEDAHIADDMVSDAEIIIEVLSPNTEAYDRGRKFLHYQSLPSLREYILISQQKIQVEIYRRKQDGKWEYERLTRKSDILTFETVSYSLPVEVLYHLIPLHD